MKVLKMSMMTAGATLSAFMALAMTAAPAQAQATRTWVSGVGDDVNPCSRTAPCKTFAGAISKTAAGGEINCLDPGGFGAVSIIKSMQISCQYTEGGALAGGNGVVVNLPAATDVVFRRGLDIFGVNPPTHGIRMIGLGQLHIQECTIRRFNAASSAGISFAPSGAAELFINDSTIAENGNGATGGGIVINPTGASGSGQVFLKNVRVENNANIGVSVNTTGETAPAGISVSMENVSVAGNPTGVSVLVPAATTSAVVNINGSQVINNSGTGIVANGGLAVVRVGNTTISGNNVGVSALGGASLHSYGDNRLTGNPPLGGGDGAFTQVIPKS
jgi:hypothetical protein